MAQETSFQYFQKKNAQKMKNGFKKMLNTSTKKINKKNKHVK